MVDHPLTQPTSAEYQTWPIMRARSAKSGTSRSPMAREMIPSMSNVICCWQPTAAGSGDDSEVIKLTQRGVERHPDDAGVLLMGGRDAQDTQHMVTETALRAFYAHYRDVMGL